MDCLATIDDVNKSMYHQREKAIRLFKVVQFWHLIFHGPKSTKDKRCMNM